MTTNQTIDEGSGQTRTAVNLTKQQREVVDYRPSGDLLLKGIPGSGKTLTIVARAARLCTLPVLDSTPGVALVRIFTFNRLLMEWISILASQLGETPPEVTTFHKWAHQALRALGVTNVVDYDDEAPRLLQAIRDKGGLPASLCAHHVLVDEAQDLTAEQLQLIKLSARVSFTVAADQAQNIYKTGFTWKSVGINVQGRTRSLNEGLRGTRQIEALAADLTGHDPALVDEDRVTDLSLLREGPIPEIYHSASYGAADEVVRNTIRLSQSENRFGTVAVLHAWRKPVYALVHSTGGRLLDRDHCDMTSPGVVVSTIHGIKGLEFDTVIVKDVDEGTLPRHAGPDDGDPAGVLTPEDIALSRRLLYVAITRARRRLVIICGKHPSRFIAEFDPRHYRRVDC